MSGTEYKSIGVPNNLVGNTNGIEKSSQNIKLFDGIIKTVDNAIDAGNIYANKKFLRDKELEEALEKDKQKQIKIKAFEDNLRGEKVFVEYKNSLEGMTATEKESNINSVFSNISNSGESEAYLKSFTSGLKDLYSKILTERVAEDQKTANDTLYSQVKTDMKFQTLSADYIDNKVNEMSSILTKIDKKEASLSIIQGYVDSLSSDFNVSSSKISKFKINSLEKDYNGGFVIKNSSVNMETPVSLEELEVLKQNDLNNLSNFINSNRYLNSNNKEMKKDLEDMTKSLESKYKSKIDEIVEFSKIFLFNARGEGKKTFNSYSIPTEYMEETFKNASYSNGKIDIISYKKLKNEYKKNYEKRNSELNIIYNAEENISNGVVIDKTNNPFAYDFYKKKANSDLVKAISNKNISYIAKYENSSYLIKDSLTDLVKQVGSSKNSKSDFIQQYDFIKSIEENSTTNNMLKNNIKPKDLFILKSKKLLIDLGVNDESFSKISSNINFQQGSIDRKQLDNMSEKYGLDEYSPEVRKQFASIALVFENEYKGEEFKELLSDYEKENTEVISGVTLSIHNSNFIIKGSGLKEEENVENAKNEIIDLISKDVKNKYGLGKGEFKLKPLPENKYGFSNMILVDSKGNELRTYNTKNYYDDYKYIKSHPGKLNTFESITEISGGILEGVLNSVTQGLVEIGDGFGNIWNIISNDYTKNRKKYKTFRDKTINKVDTVYKNFSKIYKDDVFKIGILDEADIFFGEGQDYAERTYNFVSNKINDYNYINKKVLEKRYEEKSMHNNVRSFKELEREVRQENEQMLLNLKVSLQAINEL